MQLCIIYCTYTCTLHYRERFLCTLNFKFCHKNKPLNIQLNVLFFDVSDEPVKMKRFWNCEGRAHAYALVRATLTWRYKQRLACMLYAKWSVRFRFSLTLAWWCTLLLGTLSEWHTLTHIRLFVSQWRWPHEGDTKTTVIVKVKNVGHKCIAIS